MWIKQCSIFRLPETPAAAEMEAALDNARFAPCQGLDWYSEGFTAPSAFGPQMVHAVADTLLLALKREDKVLPAGVVRDVLADKVAEIKAAEGRGVGRKEKQELKAQITDDLLPRAFTRSSRQYALLCNGLMLVDSTAASKAEKLLTKLREALGGLEAHPPRTRATTRALMTTWLLRGEAEGGFELDDEAVLRGHGDVAPEIKVRRQDLTAEEVVQLAKSGKAVIELGLVWREQVAFTLTQDFALKRIRYLDVLIETSQEQGGAGAAELADASQVIAARNLTAMIEELAGYLGGWED